MTECINKSIYKCDLCIFITENKKSLSNHRRWHNIPEYKEFQESQKIRIWDRDEKHHNWKGDNVGYYALHMWVKRRKIKPSLCEECKQNEPIDLANISGEYKRELDDWEWLCRSCHMNKDGRIKNLVQFKNGI